MGGFTTYYLVSPSHIPRLTGIYPLQRLHEAFEQNAKIASGPDSARDFLSSNIIFSFRTIFYFLATILIDFLVVMYQSQSEISFPPPHRIALQKAGLIGLQAARSGRGRQRRQALIGACTDGHDHRLRGEGQESFVPGGGHNGRRSDFVTMNVWKFAENWK